MFLALTGTITQLSEDGTELIYHDPQLNNNKVAEEGQKTLKILDVETIQDMAGSMQGDGFDVGGQTTFGLVTRGGRIHRFDANNSKDKERWIEVMIDLTAA